jgi:hypothetical protein
VLAQFEHLDEGVAESVSQRVADVGHVDAAETLHDRAQLGQFVAGGVRPGGIGEPGGHPEGALLHGAPKEPAHLGHFALGRGTVVPPHSGDAQRGVADDVGDIDRHLAVVGVEVFVHRRPRQPLWLLTVQACVEHRPVLQVLGAQKRCVRVAVDA